MVVLLPRPLLPLGAALSLLPAGCGGANPAPPEPAASATVTVTSPSFTEGGTIPVEFTCAGEGHRPALAWSGSSGAAAWAIVVSDPDAPGGNYYHWVVVDLPAGSTGVAADLPPGSRELNNSGRHPEWTPPCPPSGTHHYRFTAYALSAATALPADASLDDAFAAIARDTVAEGTLTGLAGHGNFP